MRYIPIPTEGWIGLLRTLEDKYDRRNADHEAHNSPVKNKKSEKPDEDNSNRKERTRVYQKESNINPRKGKQKNSDIHCGTHSYCVLCNKEGYPDHRYKSHSIEKCNEFDPANTKKDLDGSPTKKYASVKQFRKTEKNSYNQTKSPKKHNNILFKIFKKNSSCHELKNNKKTRKASHDYSSSNRSSVSRDSDLDSSILSH